MAQAKSTVRVNFRGKEVKKTARKAVELGVKMTLGDCVRQASREAPAAYGTLANSVKIERIYWKGGVVNGRWGAFTNYALWVEVGTGPHMPPIGPIRDWAAQKLGDPELAWPVAISISRTGTEAQPFLRPAADEHYPELAGNIRKAWGTMD